MQISIQENAKPALPRTEMICDGGLSDKLDKYELTRYLNQHHTTLLVGKPRSGKTSLLNSLFSSRECLRKVYHKIFLFQPTASGESIRDNIFDAIPDEQKFSELTIDNLMSVFDTIKALPKQHNKCIIFDDQAPYLKNGELQALFKDLCFQRRHYGVSIYFLTQTYYSVPRELRKIFNNLFIFKTSKMELQVIFEEQVEISKELIGPISRLVYDKPYQFLFINTDTQQLYKGWDRIVIE